MKNGAEKMGLILSARIWAVLACVALAIGHVRADDSAMNEGAYGPEPVGDISGTESVIAMTSETLEIAFGRQFTDVTARFTFRSSKKEGVARQLVGFPDVGAAVAESARRSPKGDAPWINEDNVVGPLKDLKTFVDGRQVKSEKQFGYVKTGAPDSDEPWWKAGTPKDGTLMAWHVMWVEFPPGRDVTIERRYRTPNGAQVAGEGTQSMFFTYIVATGGSWKGPIGRLVADVTLKDGLTVADIAWRKDADELSPTSSPPRDKWQALSPTNLRLDWRNFEPRTDTGKRDFTITTKPAKSETH
jgi:hypothetical protein